MGDVARMVRWEWFKLRRRWMPWILLGIMLLFAQLGVWGPFFEYRSLDAAPTVSVGDAEGRSATIACDRPVEAQLREQGVDPDAAAFQGIEQVCAQSAAERERRQATAWERITLPGSFDLSLQAAASIGLILIIVLTASTLGVEYGWGTLRTILVRGPGRWQYLAGKLGLLAAAVAAALLLIAAATVVSSLVIEQLASPPLEGAEAGDGWAGVAGALARTWYGFLPLVVLVALITILSGSSATAMAVGIGYYIGEPILVALLGGFFDWLEHVADFLLVSSINAWLGVATFGPADEPGQLRPFLVLLAYTIALGGLAFARLHRADISKATGT